MRFLIVLFFVLVIIFSLAIFSGNDKVTVQTIIVSGNATVSATDVLAVANRDMSGRYWHLFARNNSLIFPRSEIERDLLAELKTIKDVDISWNGWQKININVSERKPHSVWCGNDPQAVDSDCYFSDDSGYLYVEAPIFSGSMFVKDYGNIATSGSPVGRQFLPALIYVQAFTLIQSLELKNLKVVSVYFDGSNYFFTLESGTEIIFNDKSGFNQPSQNLFSALDTGNLDLASSTDKIKYIDLRFDNKIVVGKK